MSHLKKSLRLIWKLHQKLFKYSLIALVSFIILNLVLSLSLTGGLYYANKHGQLQEWLNKGVKTFHVSYDKAEVSWHHADPTLSLTNVQIVDKANMSAPIKLDSLSIDFSVWYSLLRLELVTDNLTISGLNFEVNQQQDGSFQLLGFNQSSDKSSSYQLNPAVTRWFLAQNGVHLKNVTLGLQLRNGESIHLELEQVNWVHHLGYHFDLAGTIREIPASTLDLSASLVPGDNPFNFQAWHVNFNGSLVAANFTPLFAKQSLYHFAWVSGGGEVSFHGTWENNSLQFLDLLVNLNNVNLSHSNAKRLITPNVDEEIIWQALPPRGWQVIIKPTVGDGGPTPSLVKIIYNPDAANVWHMLAKDTDLSFIGQWVNFWFAPTTYVAKAWQIMHPAGRITDLAIDASDAGGALTVAGKNLTMGSNAVFPEGWPPSEMTLNVNWGKTADKSILENINLITLSMVNPHVSFGMSGTALIPAKDPFNPTFNLKGTVTGKNLEAVKQYYVPHKEVDPGLTNWLLQGLVKIPQASGSFIWQGKLSDFPYVNGKGLFQIALHVQNGVIEPYIGWPTIDNITADILFKNQKMTIDSDQAETLGVALHQVHYEITDMRPHFIKDIVITGKANPTGTQALKYLAAMPVTGSKLDKWLDSLNLSGTLPIKLKIVIPLEEHEPVVATGDVTFNQNDWTLANGDGPFITDIQGQLHFENDVISANTLSFKALDQTLTVSIPASSLGQLKIIFQNFAFLGQSFPGLEMDVVSSDESTSLNFKHALVAGSLKLSGENQKIIAHFSQFHLPVLSNPSEDSSTLLGSILAHVPAMNIIVDQLYYGDNNLGSLEWQSIPILNGIQVNKLNLNGKDVTLTTLGKIQTLNAKDHFQVTGELGSQNYGNLLSDFGYPGVMDGGSGEIHFDLTWAGQALKPEWSSLNGTLDFGLANGKLLKIDAGLARIFGLVSLDTIFSTLSFNFQKMMTNGLAFDAMAGSYTIKDGIATTDKKGLKITGPSLSLILKGEMNFVNQTVNQTATVMPQVGTSIAIAAAFVGGPIAGVATWFADKILGNTVFKDTGLTYNVTGTFDKPVVSLTQVPTASS